MRGTGAFLALAACLVLGVAATVQPSAAVTTTVQLVDLGRLDARSSALLIAGGGGGEVTGAVIWDLAPAAADGASVVRFAVEVHGGELLADTPAGPLPVAAAAYVVDHDGRLVDFLSRGVVLSVAERAAVAAVGLRWVDQCELAPGRYSIRLVVRNHRSDRVFLDRLEVLTPAADGGPLALLPPAATSFAEGWVEARPAGSATPAEDPARGLPPARPVLVAGVPTELHIGVVGGDGAPPLRARLVDMVGRTVAEPLLELVAAGNGEIAAGRPYRLAPLDLPAGVYRLVVRTPDGGPAPALLSSLEVLVSALPASVPWPAVETTAEAPLLPSGDDALRSSRIRRAYRDALTELARGDELQARRQLASLEREIAGSSSARALARLMHLQRGEAEAIARTRAQAALPVLWLHRSMTRFYQIRNESVLAAHSSTLVEELALALAARGDPLARSFAADVLTEQAGELWQAAAIRATTRILRRALQLEPDHVDALLALGAALERLGETREAADVLARAVTLAPDAHEAALRLAVTLDRSGRQRQALQIFEELFEGAGPAWVRGLAVQELALRLVERGEVARAVALLQSAVERLGPGPRLQIQLAYSLDAAGQPHLAMELLQTLGARADATASARFRYSQWPELGPRVDHQLLAARAATGLPALHSVLAADPGEGPS